MIAWFDCFSGVSGDMILGALVDAGWPEGQLKALPQILGIDGVEVSCSRVMRCGISGIKVTVSSTRTQNLRTLPAITEIITASSIPPSVKEKILGIFHIMAHAEAEVHGCSIDEVHFHEIGAVDTIIDITGAVLAIEELGISRCTSSPLPMGSGFIKCAHGTLPVPAPAVAKIVEKMPVYGTDIESETVTPTGAAILKGLCQGFGPMPQMAVHKTGCGAGEREFADRPNLLRIWTGSSLQVSHSPITKLSTCIDDMNPELFPHVIEKLLGAGALDAFIRPVSMKKGRPGMELVALSPQGLEERLRDVIFSETTTSGIRFSTEARFLLKRRIEEVQSPWGRVKVKVIVRPDGTEERVPEYEECKRIAQEQSLPLGRVYRILQQG